MLETVYLYTFAITGTLTLLYVLFGDVFDGLFDTTPGGVLSPTVILSFISILCSAGYYFELETEVGVITGFILSALIALVLVSLMHIFILGPVARAETSLRTSINDMVGKVGELVVGIPTNGFGEMTIKSNLSIISFPASTENGESINEGIIVKVTKVNSADGVVIVEKFDEDVVNILGGNEE